MSFLLALILPLSAAMSSDIASDQASYNGETLHLEGNVSLDLELGQMRSEVATLQKGGESSNLPFAEIELDTRVFLSLKERGELFCNHAHLDFLALKGTFFSKDSPVFYREPPFELVSDEMDLILLEDGGKATISALIAKKSNGEVCRLTHAEDVIDAEAIRMDTALRTLTIDEPVGTVSSFLFPGATEEQCHFNAKTLIWSELDDTLTLQGAIKIEEGELGTLDAEDEVRITQKDHFGQKVIQKMEAQGKTVLKTHGGDKLTSFGSVTLERDTLELNAKSPILEGETPLDKQLILDRENFTLYADTARIEYAIRALKLQPKEATLHGQVRILSVSPSAPFRCAVADHAHYDPASQELRLIADPGNRVLFWHREQNLKLSASEIVITTDQATEEETITGIGTVRVFFNHEEDAKLKTLFPGA